MDNFDGKMRIIPIKGSGGVVENQANLLNSVRTITPDGDCPEETIGINDGSSDGGGGGGGGGPSTGGSTGGGVWVTVTRCDYYLVKNFYDTYVDGVYSSSSYYYTMEENCYQYSYLSHTEVANTENCDLGPGEIPIIEPEMAAALWERDICETDAFKNNSCVQGIWNTLKETNIAFNNLTNFVNTANPIAELCLDISDTITRNITGYAALRGTLNEPKVTIALNSKKLDRSKLTIARTILHETIHAELHGLVIEAERGGGFEQFLQDNPGKDKFALLWKYIKEYEINPDKIQHEFMIDYYVGSLAASLQELSLHLMSEGFRNFSSNGQTLYTSSSNSFEWNWDEFYLALAYEGLHETEEYEALDENLKARYAVYRQQLVDLESPSYECN